MSNETHHTDREAILAAVESFAVAYNSGDLDTLLAYYDEELIKIRQGAALEGKPEVARRVREAFARFETSVEVRNAEVEVAGDLAFTRGVYHVTLTSRADGQSQTHTRRYLEIWRKRGGVWRVARTMDNAG